MCKGCHSRLISKVQTPLFQRKLITVLHNQSQHEQKKRRHKDLQSLCKKFALAGAMVAWQFTAIAKVTDRPLPPTNQQQAEVEISGKVIDAQGPLPGLTVSVKGNPKIGVSTDTNGMYRIKVPANSVLVFQMIGYQPQEVAVGGKPTITSQWWLTTPISMR